MSREHPIAIWAKANEMPLKALANAAGCSEAHLRNLIAGRKDASLRLARRLTELSGGKVPMDSFIKPPEAA